MRDNVALPWLVPFARTTACLRPSRRSQCKDTLMPHVTAPFKRALHRAHKTGKHMPKGQPRLSRTI